MLQQLMTCTSDHDDTGGKTDSMIRSQFDQMQVMTLFKKLSTLSSEDEDRGFIRNVWYVSTDLHGVTFQRIINTEPKGLLPSQKQFTGPLQSL